MTSSSSQQRAIEKLRQAGGPLRTSQILAAGVHRRNLYALRDAGIVVRVSRGVYQLAELPPLSEPDIITVASRVPNGVICLVSALHFYGLTTEIPRHVSVALPRGATRPKLDWPPLLVYRFSKTMFEPGIETRKIEGVPVRIYVPAKTVADCFRFRNRLGLDVAIEALRAGLAERLFTLGEIMHYAEICRVGKIVRPFLDAMQ
jgi:predicted transcriptional regulator of viral defense system